jgi:hypothetical protein
MTPDEITKRNIDAIEATLETWSKLYYGFWIIFLGGFVLSLHAPDGLPCWKLLGLICFRSLAIVGTCLNFLMQFYAARMLHSMKLWQTLGDEPEGKTSEEKWTKFGKIANGLENALMCVGASYLLLGLILSFLIRVPASN